MRRLLASPVPGTRLSIRRKNLNPPFSTLRSGSCKWFYRYYRLWYAGIKPLIPHASSSSQILIKICIPFADIQLRRQLPWAPVHGINYRKPKNVLHFDNSNHRISRHRFRMASGVYRVVSARRIWRRVQIQCDKGMTDMWYHSLLSILLSLFDTVGFVD